MTHLRLKDAVLTLAARQKITGLSDHHAWFLSGGSLDDFAIGDRVPSAKQAGQSGARLLGIAPQTLIALNLDGPTSGLAVTHSPELPIDATTTSDTIPYAPEIVAPAPQTAHL